MSKDRRQFSLLGMFWITFVAGVFMTAWSFVPVVAPWIGSDVKSSNVRHFWLAWALTFSVIGLMGAVARLFFWFRGGDRPLS